MNNEEKQQHYDRAETLLAEQNFAAVFLAKRALSRSDRLAIGLYELKDRA